MIITVNGYHKVHLLFLDVCKQTSISHEGHYNIGGGAAIYTHSNDTEDMRVLKVVHFHTLFHQICNSVLIKET